MKAIIRKLFKKSNKSVIASDSEDSSDSEWEEDVDQTSLLEDRSELFISSFLEYCEKKFKEYKNAADVDGVAKEIKILGLELPKPDSRFTVPSSLFDLIGLLIKCLQFLLTYVIQKVLGKKYRQKAKIVTSIFESLSHEERHGIFADTGADIFYSFQYQINQITDVKGFRQQGLRKVAKDARDRAMRYLSEQDQKSIGIITHEKLTKAVLLGTPKTMYGHTIKLSRSKTQLKTSDLFEILGLKVMYANVGIMYYYKVSFDGNIGASAWEYRFALDWEKKGRWEQDYKEVEKSQVRDMDVSEMCERSILQAIVSKVLKKFKDSDSRQEEITAGVNRIEKGFNKIESGVDHLQSSVTQIETENNHIKSGINEAVCIVKRIEGGFDQLTSGANRIQEGVNQLLDHKHNNEDQRKTPLKNFWFNFMKPVANFSGREKELKMLHDLLSESAQDVVITQCATVSGLGGIGKTELARMYALTYAKQSYDGNIIWIDSETENSRKELFEKLAKKLGVRIQTSTIDQEKHLEIEQLKKVYECLSSTNCLIIFDNVEKYDDIKLYLMKASTDNENRPTILITSRSDNWEARQQGVIKILTLDVLTEEEALKCVKVNFEIEDDDTSLDWRINEFTSLLSWFPLALQTAIAYLNTTTIKITKDIVPDLITEYIKLYKMNAEKCLNHPSDPDRYTLTVYNTWRITFDRIKMNGEYGADAIDLMEKIAYCCPDNIDFYVGMKLIQRKHKGKYRKLSEQDEEESIKNREKESRKRREIWLLLKRYSLISIEENYHSKDVKVHRLVQEVVKLWIREEDREETVLRNFLNWIDEEDRFCHLDVWDYASEYSSLIIKFDLTSQFSSIIKNLALKGKHQSFDNIICQFEQLENINSNFDWHKLLEDNNISDYMIRDSGHYDELARNLCIFHAYFNKNLESVDSLTKFDNYLENFSTRFDRKILLETWYESDKPPLFFAVEMGDIKLVQWLLRKGADRNARCELGRTVIHHAAGYRFRYNDIGDVMKLLAPSASELNCRSLRVVTPLHFALKVGNVNAIEPLLKIGADPTICDTAGRNAIHLAAKFWNLNLFELFSLNAEKCNIQTKTGKTLLYFVLKHFCRNDEDNEQTKRVIEYLLEKGADPLICDNKGRNAIWIALKNRHTKAVRLFIQHGSLKSSTRFKNGRSPLHVAVASGSFEVVKSILDMGADVNCVDDNGNQLLHLLFEGHYEWYEYEELVDSDGSLRSADFLRLEPWHLRMTNLLVKKGADINCANNDGVKLIHLASKYRHLHIMKHCAESGSDYKSKTKIGRTLLHFAVEGGDLNVVEFLLDEIEISPNTLDNENITPVAIALLKGHHAIVNLFLERELFDVNVKLPNGRYPLQLALDSGNYKLVRFLIDRGADSRLVGEYGVKSVHLAAEAGDLEFLKRFTGDENELESKTVDGRIPLHFALACRKSNQNVVEFLFENSTNVNIADENGLHAFAYAIKTSTFLNSTDLDLNAPFNAFGITPLIHALLFGRKVIVDQLLNSKKLSMDAARYGDTLLGKLQISALHVAAYLNNYKAVEILTEHYKMDVNSGLNVSWTPLQAADPHSSVASFLIKRGAKIAEDNILMCTRVSFKTF